MKATDKKALERYQERIKQIRAGQNTIANDSEEKRSERKKKARKNFAFMVKTYFPHYSDSATPWFHIALAVLVLRLKLIRVLVRWGRGLAKSVVCDIFIPIWLWMNGEDVYMVIVGNNLDKATKLLSDIQAEFEANPMLIHDFGEQKLEGSWADGDFRTKDGRFIGKALGMGQSPRGLRQGALRPNLIVCDDLEDKDTSRNPKRQDDVVQWIERDLLPTMDGPVRRYLHPNNDPWPRSIQNLLEKRHPKWKVNLVEAYDEETYEPAWKEKYSDTYYKDVEDDLGVLAAQAEYNHKKHVEGKIFTDEQIQWGKRPRIDHFTTIVGQWDPAYSGNNDYNAVRVMGLKDFDFWHIKAFCRKCDMTVAIRWMYDYEDTLPEGIIINWRVERQFWNQPVQDALDLVEEEKGRPLNIVVMDTKGNKYDRIITLQPYYQNGRIYYDEKEKANNDMQQSIAQLKGIEPGYKTHDDAPDAEQQAVQYLGKFIVYKRAKVKARLGKRKRRGVC